MHQTIEKIVDLKKFPLESPEFCATCKATLDTAGVLSLDRFLLPTAIAAVQEEGELHRDLAFYTQNSHNIYLDNSDSAFPCQHPKNRQVLSSKGCITTDQIPVASMLRTLYDSSLFKQFLCSTLNEASLFEYADPLSSINLHYADQDQELGWHYDNSSFAITLLIQKPSAGGKFEFVKNVRDADKGDMNFDLSEKILDGKEPVDTLDMDAGSLVLFRGRNSMHRVTPVEGNVTRMLVVLAYNTEPGVSLSEPARMTFYGRLA